MKITTIIPTYRRPQDLASCLRGLQKQTRQADEVIVVVRDTDTATWSFLESFDGNSLVLFPVKITIPGQVAALNQGLKSATGDIIAITDDDAVPHTDWLERIEAHFLSDDSIGGVGGRDWVYINNQLLQGARERVGKVSWFGRVTGNHHLGTGQAREVDILKGANMSFRRSAISQLCFDERLRGTGAQVNNDMAFSLALKRTGWKLMYDPKVAVDHYPAQRFDEDKRRQFNSGAFANSVHNETLTLLEYFSPWQRIAFLLWINLIGTRVDWGLIQLLRFFPQQKNLALQKWLASVQGRWQAWNTWQNSRNNHKPA